MAHVTKPVTKETLDEAFAHIRSFIERRVKHLLVVEDNEAERNSILELIGNGDVHTTAVASGHDALAALQESPFDCIVLDLGLTDMSGFELLDHMQQTSSGASS